VSPDPVDRLDYPVNLRLAGAPVLVVGGGRVALGKVRGLLEAGAAVHVVAPDIEDAIAALDVTCEHRPYRRGEAAPPYRLVLTATDDRAVNQAVHDDADAAGVWVNSADDPTRCTFTLPARVRRGHLLVTVSTGGRSPALAAWLRERLDGELGAEYEVLLDVLAEARDAVRARGRSTEGLDWQSALDSGMLDLIRAGRLEEAKERLQACLSSSSD
jgi:precorrin-2 dehydrogenase/sirohydrochlorin ferrochelatase